MKIRKYGTYKAKNGLIRAVKEETYDYGGSELNSPEAVYDIMKTVFKLHKRPEEHVFEICLDAKMRPIAVFEVSHGSVNTSILNPREFYQKALLAGAFSVIAVHNHPSGNTTPSKSDIELTDALDKAGKLIGIKLSDHLIIGDNYFSFKENGRL